MNKRIMLLTAFIAVSPVLQVTASADAMYYDIKNIVEDKFTLPGKDDVGRLCNIQNALRQVRSYKEDIQNNIIGSHARVDQDKKAGIFFGLLGTTLFGISAACHYGMLFIKQDAAPFAAMGVVSALGSMFGLCKKQIDLYYNKKKINELNVVILRLEAMEKTLIQKLYPCGYCGY